VLPLKNNAPHKKWLAEVYNHLVFTKSHKYSHHSCQLQLGIWQYAWQLTVAQREQTLLALGHVLNQNTTECKLTGTTTSRRLFAAVVLAKHLARNTDTS
jgi:hypothetical protein